VDQTTTETLELPPQCVFDQDLVLVHATRSGDISAFEELVRRYDRKLFRIAQNVTQNIEDAEDVVQTAFFKAYHNLSRFRANARFSTWLIRITLNESFMKMRKKRGVRELSLNTDPDGANDGGALASRSHSIDVVDWAPNPEALYNTVEFRELLINCLHKLTPNLRAVFVLRDIEGHSIIEAAGILNLNATAVKTRLSRARMQLRAELSKYFKRRD
jgi:RNA polymerase sigma-70 factor (ECF subfamily)